MPTPRVWPTAGTSSGSSSGSKVRIRESGATPPSVPSGGKVVPPGSGSGVPGTASGPKSAPTSREIYERPGKFVPASTGSGGSGGKSAAPIDPRYRGTRPVAEGSLPRGKAVPSGGAGTDPLPGGLQPRSGKGAAGAPPAASRYAGKPFGGGVPGKIEPGASPTRGKTLNRPSSGTVLGKTAFNIGKTAFNNSAPRLIPGKPGSKSFSGPGYLPQSRPIGIGHHPRGWGNVGFGFYGGCWSPWNSYWDPCGYRWNSPWLWGSGWYGAAWHGSPWYWGYGSFGCSLSLWYPWWWYRSFYWDTCYADCWWYSSVQPCSVGAGFWWYPTTTYCPTYLYVPSTVVVVEEPATPPATAPSSVPAVVPSSEPGVAGGAPAPAEPEAPANRLARKYIELGDYYFQAGRFREAADAYARARTYAPEDATVHFVLADAAFATGDYPFAAFLIGEALRLDPSLATADADKRLFYADIRQFEAQLQQLDDHLAAKPYDAQAHLVRGYNLRFSGRSEAAVAAFQRVLQLVPDHPAARLFLQALAPAEAGAAAAGPGSAVGR
ncbi:MAG: tetratricopeptide repeat protein [Planctomycetes bacterium]|nr:tetratricopeptide repeat protein [Planctomycetota bacterium]